MILFFATTVGGQAPAPVASSSMPTRLEALQKGIANGEAGAEDRFWRDVSAIGTPLIEPTRSDDSALVTFVFRAPPAVRSVTIVSQLSVLRAPAGVVPTEENMDSLGRFTRLPGTSVWYLQIVAPRNLRAPYRIRVDSSTAGSAPAASGAMTMGGPGDVVLDPLNRNRWLEELPAYRASILELSGAPAHPWRKVERAKGSWMKHELTYAGIVRPFWVYVPAGHDRTIAAPLLVGLSSGTFEKAIPLERIVDHIYTEGVRRPPVSVVVDEIAADDTAWYKATTRFLADELVPWLRRTYGVSTRPSDVIISGTSRRGVIATLAATARPDVFGNVLSMSGGFSYRPTPAAEFEWATHQLAATDRRPVRYYLTAGTLETVVSRRNYGHYLLATNRHLRDVLRAAGYDVTYREFSSVHSELNWQDHLYDGLVHLLPAASRQR